jgi:hypothetical protein
VAPGTGDVGPNVHGERIHRRNVVVNNRIARQRADGPIARCRWDRRMWCRAGALGAGA